MLVYHYRCWRWIRVLRQGSVVIRGAVAIHPDKDDVRVRVMPARTRAA
jgi:hypothetical protein